MRRPRFSTSQLGASGCSSRTFWARSTRITSAPMSASIMAPKGPGPMPATSMMRYPVSGPDMADLPCDRARCRRVTACAVERSDAAAGPDLITETGQERVCAAMTSTMNGHSGSGRSWPMSFSSSSFAPGTSSAVRTPPDGLMSVSS